MYVVTFYSYKGGVGRTMALVNTSIALARAGRRVLVVDFDLEAPGLPSYEAFQGAPCGAGMVDYVTAYRTTASAPVAAEYIYPCDFNNGRLWIMPAGRHTQPGYTEALNSIDWQDLYENQDGYLMFEDLKQQWAQFEGRGFDYVLIDSRTGHTDVGGICTRQLPDAVAIMFVPNDQNIDGLVPIVNAIEAEKHRRKPIEMLFCPSNVPDLDDEHHILNDRLERASDQFDYDKEQAPIIHHYASLDVLAQKVFVLTRQGTKLAAQYEELRASIMALNFDDREGAREALVRLPTKFEFARRRGRNRARDDIRANAVDIRARHPLDGEIAFLAARVFQLIGEPGEQIDALTTAIQTGYELNRALVSRAYAHASLGHADKGLQDLYAIIDSPTATMFELGPALQLLPALGADRVKALTRAFDRPDEEYRSLTALFWLATSHREVLGAVADRMEQLSQSTSITPVQRADARGHAMLAMIGAGQFVRAKTFAGDVNQSITSRRELATLFNYFIADWGEQGRPQFDLLEKLREGFVRFDDEEDVNSHQCLALVLARLGDIGGALSQLDAARARLMPGATGFSCWRYLNVDREDMINDLEAMAAAINSGQALVPALFGELGITVE